VSNRAEKRRLQRQGGGRSGAGGSGGSPALRRILLVVGLIVAAVIVWNVAFTTTGEGARAPVPLDHVDAQGLLQLAQGVQRGDPEAPIAVMDFSDYQCPRCRDFTQQAKPFLEDRYIEEGLVRFVYYDFPLVSIHPNAFLAARAARCAGDQDAYWPYHNRLFERQAEWARRTDPFSNFVGYAGDVGLSRGEFRSCLGSDRHADVVTANMRLGEQLGVSGTPTLFLNTGEGRGERVEQWAPQAMGFQIDRALERLGHSPPGSDR
jgi:protein-disulfide isomerase